MALVYQGLEHLVVRSLTISYNELAGTAARGGEPAATDPSALGRSFGQVSERMQTIIREAFEREARQSYDELYWEMLDSFLAIKEVDEMWKRYLDHCWVDYLREAYNNGSWGDYLDLVLADRQKLDILKL